MAVAVWRMIRRVDLPWQSTNKRSLEAVMFRDITGLLVKWRFAARNRLTKLRPSGKRMDAYNRETKEIIELKPNNLRAIQQGEKTS
jgi:hypothetical protein